VGAGRVVEPAIRSRQEPHGYYNCILKGFAFRDSRANPSHAPPEIAVAVFA
jgi:hypothetical protein